MTENEAIKGLKYLVSGKSDQYPPDYDTYIQIAIKSLEEIQPYRELGTVEELRGAREKQIKKKVLRTFDESIKQHWCSCPVCGKGLGWDMNTHFKYCLDCGQAIDWSEED